MTVEGATWRLIRPFAELGVDDRLSVGGKGANLGELTRAGIRVPPGFVVTTLAFEEFLEALEAEAIAREIEALDAADLDAITQTCASVRGRIEATAMPARIESAIAEAHAALGDNAAHVAVRSSATSEDGDDASFAGLQDTYLWLAGRDAVLHHVRKCWASLYSTESVSYRRRLKMREDGLAMGVVVQAMVDSRASGVMFTRSPATGDRSVVVIEGSYGLGSAIVSGEVTPDKYVVSKVTGEITNRAVSQKTMQHTSRPERRRDRRPGARGEAIRYRAFPTPRSRRSPNWAAPSNAITESPRTSNGRSARTAKSICCKAGPKPYGPSATAPPSPRPRRAAWTTCSTCWAADARRNHHEPDVMILTHKDVEEIVALLDASPFDELIVETSRFKLALRRGGAGWTQETVHTQQTAALEAAAKVAPAVQLAPGEVGVASPLPGTFYRAPKPGAAPFVEVGAEVGEDTVVAIVETMKLMTPVHAGASGKVSEICIENAGFVERGTVLMKLTS